jgi:hypothetical protein
VRCLGEFVCVRVRVCPPLWLYVSQENCSHYGVPSAFNVSTFQVPASWYEQPALHQQGRETAAEIADFERYMSDPSVDSSLVRARMPGRPVFPPPLLPPPPVMRRGCVT